MTKASDWQLALRNLLRNRRRSLSTMLTLAIGLAAILLFGGFKTNINYSMLTAYVRMGGHLQVQHRDYYLYGSGDPTAYGIAGYDRLLAAIRADAALQPLIEVATPMLRFGGIASHSELGVSRTVIGTGFDPADVNRMRQWNEFSVPIVHPRFVLEGAPPDAAVVGLGVARVLQICRPLHVPDCPAPAAATDGLGAPGPSPQAAAGPAGGKAGAKPSAKSSAGSPGKAAAPNALPADVAALALAEGGARPAPDNALPRLDLLVSSGRGAPNVAAINVLAAQDQGFKELDEVSVIVQLGFAQRLVFGKAPPRATALMVQLKHTAAQPVAAARLRTLLAGFDTGQPLVVRDVEELNPFYVQSLRLFDVIFGFIFVLIGGIVLFTVGNTMNAAVVERTVEIGTLRAIGLRQGGVRRLFVTEGFLLGLAGAVVGSASAVVIAWIVNHSGLTWLPPGSSERLPLQLRVLGENAAMLATSLALIAIATLSAWWPAWRAARLNVVEALRHA
ncbi:MAG: ABC transporter permease [Burkholderiales bacterium]|nr:ABC transporter permease [Burkholderiales bacterium]